MSIEKYLENIDQQDCPAGPYGVRLKYELQKEFFNNRQVPFFARISTIAAAIMLVLLTSVIIKPSLAESVHVTLGGQRRAPLILTEGEALDNSDIYHTPLQAVNSLANLDENKTYVVKRVRGANNTSKYYVSESPARRRIKKIY